MVNRKIFLCVPYFLDVGEYALHIECTLWHIYQLMPKMVKDTKSYWREEKRKTKYLNSIKKYEKNLPKLMGQFINTYVVVIIA